MIKVGQAFCIKDYRELWVCDFFKGRTYNVVEIDSFTIAIVDNEGKTLKFNKWSPFNEYTIPNYFVSLKEHRKLKLEKLNKY